MQANDWAPEYANGLTNHFPMALAALRSMCASEQQIAAFSVNATRHLEVLDSQPSSAPLANWQAVNSLRGQYSHFIELRRYFSQQIGNDPHHPFVAWVVEELAPAISCAAFHPLIRLGHALESRDCAEVASALAYWVFAYAELSWPSNSHQSSSSLATTIDTLLVNADWPKGRLGANLVTDDMQQVHRQADFNQLVFKPNPQQIDFLEIESSILQLYLATDDFTILHGVTATYAVRAIGAQYPNINSLVYYLWQGLVNAYLSKGITEQQMQETLAMLEKTDCLSPEQIRQIACHSYNEHHIKLACVCLKMYRITGNRQYLIAISRQLQEP